MRSLAEAGGGRYTELATSETHTDLWLDQENHFKAFRMKPEELSETQQLQLTRAALALLRSIEIPAEHILEERGAEQQRWRA